MNPNLAPLGNGIRAHYQRPRPKAYRNLEESGRLETFLEDLAGYGLDKLYDYHDQGLNYAEASELVNQVLSPMSEEDEERLDKEYEFLRVGDHLPPNPGPKQ